MKGWICIQKVSYLTTWARCKQGPTHPNMIWNNACNEETHRTMYAPVDSAHSPFQTKLSIMIATFEQSWLRCQVWLVRNSTLVCGNHSRMLEDCLLTSSLGRNQHNSALQPCLGQHLTPIYHHTSQLFCAHQQVTYSALSQLLAHSVETTWQNEHVTRSTGSQLDHFYGCHCHWMCRTVRSEEDIQIDICFMPLC